LHVPGVRAHRIDDGLGLKGQLRPEFRRALRWVCVTGPQGSGGVRKGAEHLGLLREAKPHAE
jgi:hypothetical protein